MCECPKSGRLWGCTALAAAGVLTNIGGSPTVPLLGSTTAMATKLRLIRTAARAVSVKRSDVRSALREVRRESAAGTVVGRKSVRKSSVASRK